MIIPWSDAVVAPCERLPRLFCCNAAAKRRHERPIIRSLCAAHEKRQSKDCRKTSVRARGSKPSRTFNRARRRAVWGGGFTSKTIFQSKVVSLQFFARKAERSGHKLGRLAGRKPKELLCLSKRSCQPGERRGKLPARCHFLQFGSGNWIFRREKIGLPHRTRCWAQLKAQEDFNFLELSDGFSTA